MRSRSPASPGIKLFDIKCAWFNEHEYYEFFPRALLARDRRDRDAFPWLDVRIIRRAGVPQEAMPKRCQINQAVEANMLKSLAVPTGRKANGSEAPVKYRKNHAANLPLLMPAASAI
jgi:hypothetical protein